MGMFDSVMIYYKCPYCELRSTMEGQTKSLSKSMFTYRPVPRTYVTGEGDGFNKWEKDFRERLPVVPSFPFDKSHTVWKSQYEAAMAAAKLPDGFKNLAHIELFVECPSYKCKSYAEKKAGKDWSGFSRSFEAKMPVLNGYLVEELYDLELRDDVPSQNWFTYPKIQTLWKRDAANKALIVEGDYSKAEFESIQMWSVTEKLHGQNVRVLFEDGEVKIGGRTDAADLHPDVLRALHALHTKEKFQEVFPDADTVMLFGEAVGPKIHAVGKDYSSKHTFILFDVVVDGWWLEHPNVEDVAKKLGLKHAPFLGLMNKDEIQALVKSGKMSLISEQPVLSEGVVARSHPLMLFRDKTPIMFKLKFSDYEKLRKHAEAKR